MYGTCQFADKVPRLREIHVWRSDVNQLCKVVVCFRKRSVFFCFGIIVVSAGHYSREVGNIADKCFMIFDRNIRIADRGSRFIKQITQVWIIRCQKEPREYH